MSNPLIVITQEYLPIEVGVKYERVQMWEYFRSLEWDKHTQVSFKHDPNDALIYKYNLEKIFQRIKDDLKRVTEYRVKSWTWRLCKTGGLTLDTEWVHYSKLGEWGGYQP